MHDRNGTASTSDTHHSSLPIECVPQSQVEAPSLTLATCTNRIDRYEALIAANAEFLSPSDESVCVVDAARPRRCPVVARLEEQRVTVLHNCRNLGLSASRNRAMAYCRTPYLLFIDDDVQVSRELLVAVRQAFSQGAGVVGVRLAPPPEQPLARWFLSPCQFHYLAIHRTNCTPSVWGACMGLDLEQVRARGLVFRADLGRRGRQLQSGDDTTLVKILMSQGAKLVVVTSVAATHHVARERLSLTYLLRRAWWQGRTEVRRQNAWLGIQKEMGRNFSGIGWSPHRMTLGVFYSGAVVIGVLVEILLRATTGGRNAC